MNHVTLTLAYIRHQFSITVLQILTCAAGVTIIVALLLINAQVKNEFSKNLEGIDLVVGAKGSPMQLILSSVFHLDVPTGNILLKDAETLNHNRLVKSTIPLSLGDNYLGFRIVGTKQTYAKHYHASLQAGSRYWGKEMEVVLGAEVAQTSGLKVGDTLTGSHGLTKGGEEHTDFPYKVVGILEPTYGVLDRLILTSLESVWHLHEEHHHEKHTSIKQEHNEHKKQYGTREITALLVTYASPMAAVTLPRIINTTTNMQAASPAFEVARLTNFMGISMNALNVIGYFLITLAAFSMLVTLTYAMDERRYDLALMRSFGASPVTLLTSMIMESMLLSLLGVILGIVFGHLSVEVLASWLANGKHIPMTGALVLREEIWLIVMGFVIGLIAAIIPAIKLYRMDIFATLVTR